MKNADTPMTMEQQLREVNEALLVSAVCRHELTDQAETAEAALRQSEERYRTLFDLGPVAIYSCNALGVIQEFNRRAAEIWGRAPALGDTDERFCGSFKMIRPDGSFLAHDQCPMAEVLSGKIAGACDAEVMIERPDGSRVTVIVNIRPLKNERDEIIGAINCFYDITERTNAEAALRDSQSRFEALFDASPVGMYLVDAELRIRLVSRTARPVFGDIGELVGRDFIEVIHILWPPESADEIVERFRHTLKTGEPYVVSEFSEERYDLKAREYYDWQIHRIALPNGEYGVVCYFTDISERTRLTNELRQNAAELSESDRRKNEFLALLAHELRNPLAPIRNALQIMRLKNEGDGGGVQAATDMMERHVGQLERLVDDLLDVSRISRGKIELRIGRVELASAVHHAVEAARSLYENMNHELTVALPAEPVYLNVDPTRLAQVLGNLLNNACKFTDPGGHISLKVERDGEQAVIRVRDSGIGIAADKLSRIFDMFVQIDTSLERSVGGLGIGLTLVKNLVEMHGGTVEVYSTGVGQGSEFVVRLPVTGTIKADQPMPEPIVNALTTTSCHRILVVDDNRDSADTMATLLQLNDNETHTAYDGLEAVASAATFQPEVILLDIGLPKLNGYEVARKIREQPWGKNIVLVALTGWGHDEHRQKSKEAGFNGHLVKPVELPALMNLLAELQLR
jgi:PAS domain S-box-containing protein